MSVEVARCSAKLGCERASAKHFELAFQTIDEHHHLFAQSRGTCRLSVSLGKHRNLFPLLCKRFKLSDKFLEQRIIDLLQSLFYAQGNAGVVDILTCEAEMDELLVLFKAADFVELLLDEVLHSLHVVVRHHFDVLNTLGILLREVAIDVAKLLVADGNILQLRKGQMRECDEIFHFNADTIANQSILRKVRSQGFSLSSVTPINRRNGRQHVQFHISLCNVWS